MRSPFVQYPPNVGCERNISQQMAGEYALALIERGVVRWGRYAEAFAYDDENAMFSLENPT